MSTYSIGQIKLILKTEESRMNSSEHIFLIQRGDYQTVSETLRSFRNIGHHNQQFTDSDLCQARNETY